MVSTLLARRAVAAIRGAFVADAASMGTHWIYSPQDMLQAVPSVERPEFKDPPTPKYYSSREFPGHYERAGMLSPYGEQLLFVTEHVVSTKDLNGVSMSVAMLAWARNFGGRPDHALQTLMENMNGDEETLWPDCGADDSQAHIYMKIVPVTCRYAGSPLLKEKVTIAIQVHQNNKMAIAFGLASARLLESVLLGSSLSDALTTVESNIAQELDYYQEDVVKAFKRAKLAAAKVNKSLTDVLLDLSHEIMAHQPDSPQYDMIGRSCALPGSFVGPLTLMYRAAAAKDDGKIDYEQAIRENILASGDTCSRAVFLGAVLAAAGTTDFTNNVPDSWVSKMDEGVMEKVDTASFAMAEMHLEESTVTTQSPEL